MTKNQKIGLSLAGIIALSLLYWYKVKDTKKIMQDAPLPVENPTPVNVGKFCGETTSFPIVQGSKGATVCAIQIGLNRFIQSSGLKLAPLVVDGIVGEKTTEVLSSFGVATPISASTTIEIINKLK